MLQTKETKLLGLLNEFEGKTVEIILGDNGEPLFELYSVGAALGYVKKNNVGKEYARKERIEKVMKNAEITGYVQSGHTYINESELYDFMLEAHTEPCKRFKKWLTNEVLPQIRATGGYIPVKDGDTKEDIEAKASMILDNTLKYKKTIEAQNDEIKALKGEVINLKDEMYSMKSNFENQQERLLESLEKFNKHFDVYEHPSIRYNKLLEDFNGATYKCLDLSKHYYFRKALCDYYDLDERIVDKQSNKKKWLLDNLGIDLIQYFVDNVILGKIIKNINGRWVSLKAFNDNPYDVEKKKILKRWTTSTGKLVCYLCGREIQSPEENVNFNWEHAISKFNGGDDTMSNIAVAHCSCNQKKGSLDYDEYINLNGNERSIELYEVFRNEYTTEQGEM